MSTRKYIPRDATSRRSRKNQVSQAPIILVSLADFLQENWSSLIKPVMSLRMSGNSSAIYVLQMSGRVASQQRRPPARRPARNRSYECARGFVCFSLSLCKQSFPRGADAAANRSPPLFLASVSFYFLGEIPSNFDLKNVIFRL